MLLARVSKEFRMRKGLRMDGGMQLAVHCLTMRTHSWEGGEKWFLFGLLRAKNGTFLGAEGPWCIFFAKNANFL